MSCCFTLRQIDFLILSTWKVRSSAAEALYSSSQDYLDQVPEEAEDILLSTHWSQTDTDALKPIVDRLIILLSDQPPQNFTQTRTVIS